MFDAEQVIAAAKLRRDVVGATASELSDGLRAVAKLRAALDAFEARVVAAYRALGDLGPVEASSWLRGATRASHREASRRVELAEQLATLPDAADALADGRLTADQAGALARAAHQCPSVLQHADACSWRRRRPGRPTSSSASSGHGCVTTRPTAVLPSSSANALGVESPRSEPTTAWSGSMSGSIRWPAPA